MTDICLYVPDQVTQKALQDTLSRFGRWKDCRVDVDPEAGGLYIVLGDKRRDRDVLPMPLRLGVVLDRLNRSVQANAKTQNKSVSFGKYRLEADENCLVDKRSGDVVRLTDKEKHILCYLYENKGKTVERAVLLEEVWGYAQTIETHTLETHIYRLRQKIEDSPASPKILLTSKSGYTLGKG